VQEDVDPKRSGRPGVPGRSIGSEDDYWRGAGWRAAAQRLNARGDRQALGALRSEAYVRNHRVEAGASQAMGGLRQAGRAAHLEAGTDEVALVDPPDLIVVINHEKPVGHPCSALPPDLPPRMAHCRTICSENLEIGAPSAPDLRQTAIFEQPNIRLRADICTLLVRRRGPDGAPVTEVQEERPLARALRVDPGERSLGVVAGVAVVRGVALSVMRQIGRTPGAPRRPSWARVTEPAAASC
jgi:hypothetical protein